MPAPPSVRFAHANAAVAAGSVVLAGRAPVRARAVVVLMLSLWCLGPNSAGASGPVGGVGPVGTPGPSGPVGADAAGGQRTTRSKPAGTLSPPAAPSATTSAPAAQAAPRGADAPQGNRIEVTGNTAAGTVGCHPDGTTSVNSVDVAGARLEGKTVIVQGRNANDVQTRRDCPPGAPPRAPGAGQTNSIRIR